MKKANILVSLLAVACLTGCAGNGNSNNDDGKYKLVIEDFGVAKIEAEDLNLRYWEADPSYDVNDVVESDKASGGKYLAAAYKDGDPEASFTLEIKKFSKVTMSVAYAQMASDIATQIDMSKVYHFDIENLTAASFASGKNMLATRSSAETWTLMDYVPQEMYPGKYKVTLTLEADAPMCPSIDYLQFKTIDATTVDPSDMTEADIPDNDMRNLQQYKYISDSDVKSYKSYATGGDFSAPRGMKLKYDDVADASKYYVQVAESEAALASATVRESTAKYYYFQNAKLATKYYYRAATSQDGLNAAKVYNITSTDVAPRVVYVPDVLNFRDIGGWESSLVKGAKINQGLYFRCAQLDAASGSTSSKLDTTGKGMAALKELGIKCDIDMRDIGNQPNRGKGPSKANATDWPVTFVSAAVPSGSEPDRWEGSNGTWMGTSCNIAEQYVTIFNAIANCDNEPCMLHCTYGADRTGIVTFFLESLLGMSQEDMTRDYLWTQFTQGRSVKIEESEGAEFPQWIKKTNNCEGETFADKMENHLESFGIAHDKLEHIREIFVPGYVAK